MRNTNIEKTRLFLINIDSRTNFANSNIDSAFIEQSVKDQLKYNIRRLSWHAWCDKRPFKKEKSCRKNVFLETKLWLLRLAKLPTRWFWSVSNYGISSLRIIGWFCFFAFFYAFIYWLCSGTLLYYETGYIYEAYPVTYPVTHSVSNCPFIYDLYFSIVTMTTLGFGDIHANPNSQFGQFVLMSQVIIGYILLGALVTRLGVVFTGSGPVEKPPLAEEDRLAKEKRIRFGVGVLPFIALAIVYAAFWRQGSLDNISSLVGVYYLVSLMSLAICWFWFFNGWSYIKNIFRRTPRG